MKRFDLTTLEGNEARLNHSERVRLKEEDMSYFVPVTPGGTPIIYGAGSLSGKLLASKTKEQAISNLLQDAAHMPYGTWENFKKCGYTIEEWKGWTP